MQTAIQLGKKDNTADAKTGEIEGHVRRTKQTSSQAGKKGFPLILENKIPGVFQDHFGIFQVS